MNRSDLSTTGVLNAIGFHVRRVAAPAAGLVILTALPFRLLQVHFIDLLARLRNQAAAYGNLLTATATLAMIAFVLSLYGRAVYMRACRDMPDRWRDLLRLETRSFLAYLYVSLLLQLSLLLFGVTLIAIPLVIVLAGVAAAASSDSRPVGPIASIRALGPYLERGNVLVGLFFVFAIGWLVVFANVWFFARAVVWALEAAPAFDAVKWMTAVSGGSPRFILLAAVVSTTVIEPFWLAAMHVYGDRIRSRETGDDLRRRFRALLGDVPLIERGAAVLILCALATSLSAQRSISVGEYAADLAGMREALLSSKFAEASAAARDLDGVAAVRWHNGTFEPDRSLIAGVAKAAQKSTQDPMVVRRLSVTIEALRGDEAYAARPTPDPALLERIQKSEETGELWRGGEVMQIPAAKTSVFELIGDYLRRAINWLGEKLERIVDWILKLWPKRQKGEERVFLGMPVVVWIVTLLVVATVAFVAAYVLRRSRYRGSAPAVSAAPALSRRDEDPLSRDANEWEAYAAQLAGNGRFREAIRAWYHAVLVTLYRTGVVHYRKGRTNWEYVRTLSPDLAWRPRFVTITREFEREWYGRHEAGAENLDFCAREAKAILAAVRGER